jgi:hypothetical protein
MSSTADKLRVLSLIPGRVRLHLPDWLAGGRDQIEDRLARLPGVCHVRANALTGNVLIRFDPRAITEHALLAACVLEPGPHRAAAPARKSVQAPSGSEVLRAGLHGALGHALVDTVFYTVTFAEPFGLPLAGLGLLHLALDVVVWSVALTPLLEWAATARDGNGRDPAGMGLPVLLEVPAGL